MRISKSMYLSILALAGSAMAVPAPIENVERSTEVSQDVHTHEKRAFHVVIALGKIIGGALLSRSAQAGIDVVKGRLTPEVESHFNNWNAARTNFTKELVEDLWITRVSGAKGIACINGGYEWSPGSVYEGPIDVKFEWDAWYQTDYDCFEIHSGTITNKGDGGYVNVAYKGCSPVNNKVFTC